MEDDRIAAVYAGGYRRLVGLIYAVCGDHGEAEDVVAESFVRALAQRRRLDAIADPEAWIRTIALNLARSRWRRRQTGQRLLLRVASTDRNSSDGSTEAGRTEDQVDLMAALAKLPRGQREVLVLHYVADLTINDIAEMLRMPAGTVKARLSRGRKALAHTFGEVGTPSSPNRL